MYSTVFWWSFFTLSCLAVVNALKNVEDDPGITFCLLKYAKQNHPSHYFSSSKRMSLIHFVMIPFVRMCISSERRAGHCRQGDEGDDQGDCAHVARAGLGCFQSQGQLRNGKHPDHPHPHCTDGPQESRSSWNVMTWPREICESIQVKVGHINLSTKKIDHVY